MNTAQLANAQDINWRQTIGDASREIRDNHKLRRQLVLKKQMEARIFAQESPAPEMPSWALFFPWPWKKTLTVWSEKLAVHKACLEAIDADLRDCVLTIEDLIKNQRVQA